MNLKSGLSSLQLDLEYGGQDERELLFKLDMRIFY